MQSGHESVQYSNSGKESLEARNELFERLKSYPASPEETERSLGLFLRASLLARMFAIREIYEKIVPLPGIIMDVGTWRGQTAIICENLRAIFEPLNFNRRIVCFDTFEGYKGFSDKDKATALHCDGTYKVENDYAKYLDELIQLHEKNNALGHNFGKHKVIKGDCRLKIAEFFKEFPNEIVALAFFDVNSYDPTSHSFKAIWNRVVPGGIVAFWQLTRHNVPAEGMVYAQEILNQTDHVLRRSEFYPSLSFLQKK